MSDTKKIIFTVLLAGTDIVLKVKAFKFIDFSAKFDAVAVLDKVKGKIPGRIDDYAIDLIKVKLADTSEDKKEVVLYTYEK